MLLCTVETWRWHCKTLYFLRVLLLCTLNSKKLGEGWPHMMQLLTDEVMLVS